MIWLYPPHSILRVPLTDLFLTHVPALTEDSYAGPKSSVTSPIPEGIHSDLNDRVGEALDTPDS